MKPKFKKVSFAKEPKLINQTSYEKDSLEENDREESGIDRVPQAPRNSPILSNKHQKDSPLRQRTGTHYSLKKELVSECLGRGVRKARSKREETLTNAEKQYLTSLLLPMIVVSHSDNRRSSSAPEIFYSGESVVRHAVLKLNALQNTMEESTSLEYHGDHVDHGDHGQPQLNHLQNAMNKVRL